MSISFVLCSWDGGVEDETYDDSYVFVRLMKLLYDPNSRHPAEFKLLKYVDLHEFVRFNARQMPDLIADLELLKSLVPAGQYHDEEVSTVERLIALAQRCRRGGGRLFLDFVGD